MSKQQCRGQGRLPCWPAAPSSISGPRPPPLPPTTEAQPNPAQALVSRQLLVHVDWVTRLGQETPGQLFSYIQRPRRPRRCEKTAEGSEGRVRGYPASLTCLRQVYRSRRLRERRGLLRGSAAGHLLPVSNLQSGPTSTPGPRHSQMPPPMRPQPVDVLLPKQPRMGSLPTLPRAPAWTWAQARGAQWSPFPFSQPGSGLTHPFRA